MTTPKPAQPLPKKPAKDKLAKALRDNLLRRKAASGNAQDTQDAT
jgi:hypothetical protein